MQLRRSALMAVLASAVVLSCAPEHAIAPYQLVSGGADLSFGSPAQVVISQVYGGGGNSGAQYRNKFVELFNRGGTTASLAGWSIQSASATGAGNFGGSGNVLVALSGSIAPGQYVLVQVGTTGANGAPLPTPDIIGAGAVSAPAAASAKVLIANTSAAFGCNGGSTPCSPAQLAQIVDLVGYGGANFFEGTAAAPTLSNTTAGFRKDGGCQDTQENGADFTFAAPGPRNRSSALHVCAGTIPVGPLDHVTLTGPTTVVAGSTIQLAATPQDANNQTVSTATVTWASGDVVTATVDATGKVTGVAANATPVVITATAVDTGGITKSASTQVTVATPAIGWIDLSSSSTSFPPGFQTQLFTTARVSSGGTIVPATFTFEALDPQYATIQTVQNTGIVTGVSAPADPGTTRPGFRITATPIGGGTPFSFVTHSITIETPVTAPTTIYATSDEFGDPTPAGASDPNDLLIRRTQYTLSYNESRGTPNWVSYELDTRQMVAGQDRCNCFSADPLLPADKQILTADYTSGGYDRGHMTRSADRTAANVDNATTFYLTNVVPQMADLNQGVWAQFENALADSARAGRAVYIITGPLYSRSHGLTFLKNEGKVAIPDSTWKVALIGPGNAGNPFTRANVQTWGDLAGLTILAVNMPNVAGVRNDPWAKYLTTARAIEQATGYDFLSLLATAFDDALEANDHAPISQFSESGTANEGSPLTFDASASSDPDLGRSDLGRTEALTYDWQFSDGSTASGRVVTKSFATYGSYTATLVVSDAFGWPSTRSQDLSVANVPPVIASFAGATILQGESYNALGSFTDPGVEPWTATVDYGDGAGSQVLALSGKSFVLAHTFANAGNFTVTVRVSDGDATGSRSATVVVQTPAQGIANLVDAAGALANLNNGEINSLKAKLRASSAQLNNGQATAASNMLEAFINELQALVNSGRASGAATDPIIAYAQRVIAAIGGSVTD